MLNATVAQTLQTAVEHQQAGRLAEAEALYRQVLDHNPNHPDALHLMAVLAMQVGRADVGEQLLRRVLAVAPDHAPAHNSLGNLLHRAGRLQEAAACYRTTVSLAPDVPDGHFNLGNALRELGRGDEAIACYTAATAIQPGFFLAHNNLGSILAETGKTEEAVACFARAIAANPGYPDPHYNLGSVLRRAGRAQEAIESFRRALVLRPDYPEALSSLGNALRDRGRLNEAIACYERALAIAPDFTAYSNLGAVLLIRGRADEAILNCGRAVQLAPWSVEAQINLGSVLRNVGRLGEAIACFKRALEIRKDTCDAHAGLGAVLKDQGRIQEAMAAYQRAIDLKPEESQLWSNLLLAMHYDQNSTAAMILQAHGRWEKICAQPLYSQWRRHDNQRDPERRIRVGYVSADFREHPVGRAMLPLLEGHDRVRAEVTCYSGVLNPDALTARVKSRADRWREIAGLSDAEVVELIRRDGIDILVDLAGHTGANRLLVFARKPAPVQITYGAYPATVGLSAIAYRITDDYLDPPGKSEDENTEKLLRLRGSYWCYPADNAAMEDVGALPMAANGHVTFGSLNNPAKCSPAAIALWSGVLKAVPNSKMMLLVFQIGNSSDYFVGEFAKHGIIADRLIFTSRGSRQEYLKLYQRIDIGLDPTPYNGHMTSCDSFWMGVPVVSLRGDSSVGRGGVSLLTNLELGELIAGNDEQYIEIAKALALDSGRLCELREGLRERMKASILCDGKAAAGDVERLYREVWREWCTALAT